MADSHADESAKQLARNINALVNRGAGDGGVEALAQNGGQPLAAPAIRPNIGAARGIARLTSAPGNGEAGIASPLTETAYAERLWHAPRSITASDGVFTFVLTPVRAIQMVDANGRDVRMIYAEPA